MRCRSRDKDQGKSDSERRQESPRAGLVPCSPEETEPDPTCGSVPALTQSKRSLGLVSPHLRSSFGPGACVQAGRSQGWGCTPHAPSTGGSGDSRRSMGSCVWALAPQERKKGDGCGGLAVPPQEGGSSTDPAGSPAAWVPGHGLCQAPRAAHQQRAHGN